MKKLFVILVVLLLSACRPGGGMSIINDGPQEGPPELVQGYRDGCQSGISAYGNDYYKSLYPFKQDARLVGNKTYLTIWRDAYNYCRHWMNEFGREGMLGRDFSDEIRDPRVAREGAGVVPPIMGW